MKAIDTSFNDIVLAEVVASISPRLAAWQENTIVPNRFHKNTPFLLTYLRITSRNISCTSNQQIALALNKIWV